MIAATTTGNLQGLEKKGVLQFRGIPYARAAARFRPAEPVEPWSGVRQATQFGPMAPQNPAALETMVGGQSSPSAEDCLVLNVFTPAVDDRRRPVMVWIHGGGFASGSGHVAWYNGTHLAHTGDVVVVTINYRLGALGFLHLGHLAPELAGSGANGLRDQVTALRWVRDNIAGFGGDPDNVTIFGESAGGMSVGALLGTPEAAGLFHRAIAQSGAARNVQSTDDAEWVTDLFLRELGLSPTSAEGLLDAPVDEILRAQATVTTTAAAGGPDGGGRRPPGLLAFQPVVDGSMLPQPPLEAVRAGNAADVPLVIGTTADEWNLFHIQARQSGPLDEARLLRRMGHMVGTARARDVLDAYRSAQPGADLDGLACAAMTDLVFRIPAIRLAEAQLPHSPRVSMYRFDLASRAFDGALGACHAIEIPFVFGNLDVRGVDMFLGGIDEPARALSDLCGRAWLAAAHTGSPELDDGPWPAYDLDRRATRLLDRTPGIADDPGGELRAVWDELDGVPA